MVKKITIADILKAKKIFEKNDITGRYNTLLREKKYFGGHPNDFEKSCCFKDQIEHIGEGTKDGIGELVKVKMQSGKVAIFQLFSERYNVMFEDTGQRNWKYLFIKYE